ncbi:hypothetical protein BPAE_0078g00380 [Botrytis paeoniae]|uniref:Uncharacterized protein n=1 Tax=Botrytis paeoniae TaxID=278948 RepID=A0A4Z1FRC9_9HELO|nr:hypothetical protein BPAE_0078g00380 [Botrytis paeoniae]
MPVKTPVPVSGSIQPPTVPLGSTSTSPLTVVAVPVPAPDTENLVAQLSTNVPPVTRRWRSLDSTTGKIDNGHNVENERLEKIDFLRREIYHVEQELKGAETRILKFRDELYALHGTDWTIQRMEDLLENWRGRKRKKRAGEKGMKRKLGVIKF